MLKHTAVASLIALVCQPSMADTLCTGGTQYSVACPSLDAIPNAYIGYASEGEPCDSRGELDDWLCYHWGAAWTISRSADYPFDNVGPILDSKLYLWLACLSGPFNEWAAAELNPVGDVNVESVEMMNGFLNAGGSSQLLLHHVEECVSDEEMPVLVAVLHVAGSVSVEDRGWGSIKADYLAN